jgi:hypothetical protein
MPRSSNFRSSAEVRFGLHAGVERESVEEFLQGLLPRQFRAAIGGEAAFLQPDSHRPSLAANLPAPARVAIGAGNRNVERPAWRGTQHDQSRQSRSAISMSRTRRSAMPEVGSSRKIIAAVAENGGVVTRLKWFRAGPEADSRRPTRLRADEGRWGRSRSFAGACEPGFADTGYCRADCRSRSP